MRADNIETHRAKMARKAARNATMTPGWTKQGPMPTLMEFHRLPKLSSNCGPRLRPSKNDKRAYRKSIWPIHKIGARLFARDFIAASHARKDA